MIRQTTMALGATAICAAVAAGSGVSAADLSARDIMEKNFFVTKVSSLQLESTMVLINDKGQERSRRSTGLVKLQPNGIDSKLVVRFDTPADIKGTSFLQVEPFRLPGMIATAAELLNVGQHPVLVHDRGQGLVRLDLVLFEELCLQ